jgi:ferredoxin-NADP reductase
MSKKTGDGEATQLLLHQTTPNVFELIIVLLEGGAGTTYLFNEVNEGSLLTLRGPVGVNLLYQILLKQIFFLISTGTGIAPFRSMVKFVLENKIPHKNIHFIFGCRKFADAYIPR